MDQNPSDRVEKRSLGPLPAAALVIGGGIVGIVVISIIGLILRLLFGLGLVGLVSPFYEEPLKALGLIALAMFFPAVFKSKKIGAALGLIAGALFGLFEIFDFSILYNSLVDAGLLSRAAVNVLLAARAFTSLPMHLIASTIFGLGIACAAMSLARPGLRQIFSGNALSLMALSVGFHWVYNLFNIIPALLLKSDAIGIILGFIVMLAGLYMAYRVYRYIPSMLDRMPHFGAKDLFMRAMGWSKKGGMPMPERRP